MDIQVANKDIRRRSSSLIIKKMEEWKPQCDMTAPTRVTNQKTACSVYTCSVPRCALPVDDMLMNIKDKIPSLQENLESRQPENT